MTKFSLFYYFYSTISTITPVLFIRNVLDSFYLPISILRNSQLKSVVCRLPFAVNVTLNLSIFLVKSARFSCSLLCIFEGLWRRFSAFHSSWEPRLITNHHFEVARETGSRLHQSALLDCFGRSIFNMAVNSSPKKSPTMHFDNYVDPVPHATSKWRIEEGIKRKTHMVMIGATESKLAINIPISAIHAVSIKARVGSPDLEP